MGKSTGTGGGGGGGKGRSKGNENLSSAQQANVDTLMNGVRSNLQLGNTLNESQARAILMDYVKTGDIPKGDLFTSFAYGPNGQTIKRVGDNIITVDAKTGDELRRLKISSIPKVQMDQLIQLHAFGKARRGTKVGEFGG